MLALKTMSATPTCRSPSRTKPQNRCPVLDDVPSLPLSGTTGQGTNIMPTKAGKTKSASAASAGKKPNGLQKPVQPSKELVAVVGFEPLSRGEVVKKVWDYIKQHKLQNPDNGREILADKTLEVVFGQKKVSMFEMNKHLTRHLG